MPSEVIPLSSAEDTTAKGGLVSMVIERVNEHVRQNRLAIGDLLPSEGAFAAQLGVSRVVMREAFRSLATMGIIDVGSGRRARVSAIDSNVLAAMIDHAVHIEQISIQQIYDLRRTLEARTVTLAALRRLEPEADRILHLAAAMRADFHDAERVMDHDIAFHEAITAAARNPSFSLVLGGFEKVMRQTWPIGWRSRTSDALRMESVESHEEIARAIKARNPQAAQVAMAEHFDKSVKALISAGLI
jgi:GntR family transcriptional regulator, transcriptional repressor for pyruvate dehydrogenase complex